jgi:hypothetical protein
MPKTIMISGPHAIGKSTTAEKLATKHDFLFVSSFAGKIAKDMGYDLNNNPNPKEILAYQWKLLRAFQMHFEATAETDTVYDRSPLDFAVYTIMEFQKRDGYGTYVKEVAEYVKECFKTTDGYCSLLVIPEADLDAAYEDKGNRPTFSEEQVQYRKNYERILKLYAGDLELADILIVPADKQYDERVQFISEAIEKL